MAVLTRQGQSKEVQPKELQPKTVTSPRAAPLTFDEFWRWQERNAPAEWVDGQVEEIMPTSRWHQDVLFALLVLMRQWIEAGNGGVLLFAPFVMRFSVTGRPVTGASRKGRGREPDVLFVSAANESRVRETFVDGPADVVIELISPESQERDRYVKFAEYEKAGVREYWLIDVEAQVEEFYRRDSDTGLFVKASLEDGTRYHSEAMPDFVLDVTLIRRRPLPTLRELTRDAE